MMIPKTIEDITPQDMADFYEDSFEMQDGE